MILITLGTQVQDFSRLLKAVDNQIEKGNIKDEVIAQVGNTKYESNNMKILDLIASDEFDKLVSKCDILITHGGVGSILAGINAGKTVIAAPRLKKYKEHVNDHQIQIIKRFSDLGYILELEDFNKIDKVLEKAKKFKAKKFESNTDNLINMLEQYIDRF